MKNKKSRNKEPKLVQLQSMQNFSPILDIKEGVISTKDGKFVKLMEFSPINFKLRSIDEQGAVISQFAALLRTMPANFHIKVVSKKSEVSKVVEILQGHYAEEDNARCRKMQQEQIETIENTGRERGVSRRFYIAFEYEPPIGLKKSPSLRDIRYNLDTMARTIASGMENCGNECISPTGKDSEDDWLMATLYSIFSRGQEEVESYEDHKFRTLARYAMATQEFGGRNDLNVPINDFICPALIDNKTSPNYLVVKGVDSAPDIYYSFLYTPTPRLLEILTKYSQGGLPMNYLGNAFSLQMVETPCTVEVQEVQPREIPSDLVSCIGHEDTAAVVGNIIDKFVPVNRINIRLVPGDVLYVAQVTGGRLPEGAKTLPSDLALKFLAVTVK